MANDMSIQVFFNDACLEGFVVYITDGKTNYKFIQTYTYGINCSYNESGATENCPYVEDILNQLYEKYQINPLTIDVYTGGYCSEKAMEEFIQKFMPHYRNKDFIFYSPDSILNLPEWLEHSYVVAAFKDGFILDDFGNKKKGEYGNTIRFHPRTEEIEILPTKEERKRFIFPYGI